MKSALPSLLLFLTNSQSENASISQMGTNENMVGKPGGRHSTLKSVVERVRAEVVKTIRSVFSEKSRRSG